MIFTELKVTANQYKSPIYTQYVAEVTSTFLKEIYKEYGFRSGGSGGSMPYDVEEIEVSFDSNQSATVEQARELEIKLTERFVQIINGHEKIRPFLREYPFPSSRVRVDISFTIPSKTKLPIDNSVLLVFQAKNRIFYRAINPDNQYVLKPIMDEPYEEALKIVQNNALKKGKTELESL
jgi:hypothetical protein